MESKCLFSVKKRNTRNGSSMLIFFRSGTEYISLKGFSLQKGHKVQEREELLGVPNNNEIPQHDFHNIDKKHIKKKSR